MSKTLKRILTASAALLMLASAGASFNNNNVSAKRHHRIHRVYRHHRARKPRYRHYARSHESGANWYFHNAYKLKRRYLNKNANFDHGWIDADTINGREMQYDGMTEHSSNCFPQMTAKYAGRGRYGEGWVTAAYLKWNDTRDHQLNSRRSNRMRNLRNVIRNYNQGIDYLQDGLARNSQTGNIYLSGHGHWFRDEADNN